MKVKVQFWHELSASEMAAVIQDMPEITQRFTFLKAGPNKNLYEIEVDKASVRETIQKLNKEKRIGV